MVSGAPQQVVVSSTRLTERGRFAATVVAQIVGVAVGLATYFILYGSTWNAILTMLLIVFALSVSLGLAYADLVYDMLEYCRIRRFLWWRVAKPTRIPVNRVIMILSGANVFGLFLLVRWSVTREPYWPLFITLLTVVIILRAPEWWVWALTAAVGVAYGGALFLEHQPIPSAVTSVHVSRAHLIVLVFCLCVVAIEHGIMRDEGQGE